MCTKDFKSTKAITLIALVVSIVVLLILAGVSVVTLTGDNGILSRTQYASIVSDIARVEEEANLILTASVIDNKTSGQAVKGLGTILSELKAEGKIEGYDTTENADITNIKFDVSSITLGVGDNEELIATFESGSDTGEYYAQIKGKKYTVSKINDEIEIGKTEITTGGNSKRVIADVLTSDSTVVTAEKKGNDEIILTGVAVGEPVTITVKYTDEIYTTITVTVKSKYIVRAVSENADRGTVSINPSSVDNEYAEESIINLIATESDGYYFDGWYTESTKLSNENSFFFTVPDHNVSIEAKFLKYGKTVNLGTVTVNGKDLLCDWQFFWEDTNNVYLIYADYLEEAQCPVANYIWKYNGYIIQEKNKNRNRLLNYSNGYTQEFSKNWSSLNEAIKVAIKNKIMSSGVSEEIATESIREIETKGTPTPEQWVNSYNENYGTELGAKYFTSGQTYYDGNANRTVGCDGYLFTNDISVDESRVVWKQGLRIGDFDCSGYPGLGGSNMYYPHPSDRANYQYFASGLGYWLARILVTKQ